MYRCDYCAFGHIEYRYFLQHLRVHADEDSFRVKCFSCPATFKSLVSFRRHKQVHSHHPASSSACGSHQLSTSELQDVLVDSHQELDNSGLHGHDCQSDEEDTGGNISQRKGSDYEARRSDVAKALLRLKAGANLTDEACTKVAKEFEVICSNTANEVRAVLGKTADDVPNDELPTWNASREFQNKYCFSKFLKETEGYCEPIQVNLPSTPGRPRESYQYIPLKTQLQFLMDKGLVTEEMLKRRKTVAETNSDTDVYDDIYVQDQNDGNEQCIDLIMYFDEVQTGNALGPSAKRRSGTPA